MNGGRYAFSFAGGYQGGAISIAAIHLNYRVNAVLQQKGGSGDVGHVRARMAMVRNLNCVRRFGENTRLFNPVGSVGSVLFGPVCPQAVRSNASASDKAKRFIGPPPRRPVCYLCEFCRIVEGAYLYDGLTKYINGHWRQ